MGKWKAFQATATIKATGPKAAAAPALLAALAPLQRLGYVRLRPPLPPLPLAPAQQLLLFCRRQATRWRILLLPWLLLLLLSPAQADVMPKEFGGWVSRQSQLDALRCERCYRLSRRS